VRRYGFSCKADNCASGETSDIACAVGCFDAPGGGRIGIDRDARMPKMGIHN